MRLNSLSLRKKVLDQMSPFVHFEVDQDGLGAPWVLRDDDLGSALVEIGDDGVAVERLIGKQRAKIDAFEERFDADGVKAMPGQKDEADEIAKRIGQSEDFGGHPAF